MRERLKKARKELGYTQSEFAQKLGLTQVAYNLIETGKTRLSDKHIKPICAIFSISEDWLRSGDGEMFDKNINAEHFLAVYQTLNDKNKVLIEGILDTMLENQTDYHPPAEE